MIDNKKENQSVNTELRVIKNPHGEQVGTIDLTSGNVEFETTCTSVEGICEEFVNEKDNTDVKTIEKDLKDVLSLLSYDVVDPNKQRDEMSFIGLY